MLLGRERELAHIEGLLTDAGQGTSAALVLHGPPGIGKSSLVAAAADRAAEAGFTVLRARGFESESDIPFAGLNELLSPLLGLRDRIPEPQARALGTAFALEAPTPFDRFAVAAGMLSLLDVAGGDGPVLACVDDVHWLDEASCQALAFVARRLGREGVVLLLAARPEPGVLDALAGIAVLGVDALGDADARALLEHSAGDGLADTVAGALVGTAQGNPLALVEIPRALSAAQLAGRAPAPAPLPAGATIERAFARQLEPLPATARTALLLAAAMTTARLDRFHQAREVLGLPPGALAPAQDAGLVSVADAVELFHPLLRSAVYHGASTAARREVHRALAVVSQDPTRKAWHLAAAADGPDEEVAAALEAAGHAARTRGGPLAAGSAFERAAQLSTDTAARARRLLEAALDLAAGGRPDQGRRLVEAAQALGLDDELATQAVRVRGRVEMACGSGELAHDLVMAEAERVRERRPVAAAGLMLEGAAAHMMTGDMEALVRAGDRARALLAGADPVLDTLAGVLVGEAHAALGNEEEADALLDPAVPVLTGEAILAMPPEIVGMAGQCSIWYERWDRAALILDRLVGAARDASAVSTLMFPLAGHAILDFRRGRWQSALADAGEAERLARETGAGGGHLAFVLAVLAHVEAALGRSADARAHARESLVLCDELGAAAVGPYGHHALGLDALGRGDAAQAVEHLERAARTSGMVRMQRGLVQYGIDRVEALARAGRTEEAHLALEEFADRPSGGRWASAALARGRGLLAAGSTYEDHFEHALGHHAHDGQPFEAARTQLMYGERLRRDRRRADAREQLADALATFERLGAAPWAERARSELRAAGTATVATASGTEITPEAAAAAGLEELTPQELQIARLVAYGLTNREVAAKLFLSPKTIEYHLSQIYRKLDLRSRTQLASLLTAELQDARAA